MPNKIKEKLVDETLSKITLKQVSWRYEDEPIIVDIPDRYLIHSNKITVLGPFIKEFRKNVEYQSKIRNIKEFLSPLLLKITQVDSVFVCFSETINKISIVFLLSCKEFDRQLAKKLFDIRLLVEDKYNDYQLDVLEIPKFDRKEEDIVSNTSSKIYP